MKTDYTSFLVCFHEKHIDIYREGLPIGVVRDGRFEVHQHTMPDGSKHPVKVDTELLQRVGEMVALVIAQNAADDRGRP